MIFEFDNLEDLLTDKAKENIKDSAIDALDEYEEKFLGVARKASIYFLGADIKMDVTDSEGIVYHGLTVERISKLF